ncbi:MAG TPA: flagellar hook-associated protein FlgL [Steroidobacteraceae bacterium]|nr:flagellar hook-associated protein FlgL [Steroidobacteraceae bacterium]
MTISTVTFQNNALADIQALETGISTTQNQLSTGLQLQNAADNPVAMSEVNQLNQQLSASQQYVSNGSAANTNLQLEEQALTNATNLLQSAQSLATEANDGSLTATDRQDLATQLQQQLAQLVSIANSTDSNGNYLFSGQASGTQPFAQSSGAVSYSGSDSVNQLEISAGQFISAGDTGSSVFMNIPAGNGTFTTAAAAANTGTASIDPGTVTDPSEWAANSGTYTLSFTTPTPGQTQYQVTNAAGNTVTSGTYTSGDAIAFDGIQVTVSGTPAAGDQFTIAPAGTASVFSTISGLITTLNSTSLNSGQLATQIGTAEQQLGNALNNFDNVQASVGARINAVSASQTSAQSQQTTLQSTVSQLSDTDYAAATTQLSTQEIALQAAEESYASIAKLSLFNYLA